MGLISTRRRKLSALAASIALTGSTLTGLVMLSGGAQAAAPNPLAVQAADTADVLTGMRFLQQASISTAVSDQAVTTDGVVDLTVTPPTTVDPQIGWFQATYADKQQQLANLLSAQLDIPAEQFLAAWSFTPDVRMRVMFAALSHVGQPYVWNSAGPDSFDCSGLVMFAWGTVGIELPHFSMAQANSGEAELAGELKVGDLVHAPGHIMMSLGVGDAVVESSGGGVQVSHSASRADAWTDPLRPRTVTWQVADGVRRTADGRIAHGDPATSGGDQAIPLAPAPSGVATPVAPASVGPAPTIPVAPAPTSPTTAPAEPTLSTTP